MHRCMLRSPTVEVDGHPVVHFLPLREFLFVLWIGIAEKVPRRIDEGVERVRLALRFPFALWTFHLHPLLYFREWWATRPFRQIIFHVRQLHRQVLLGNGNAPAFRAMNDGDRDAPVALSRDYPVTQMVLLHQHPVSLSYFRYGLVARESREFARVVQYPLPYVRRTVHTVPRDAEIPAIDECVNLGRCHPLHIVFGFFFRRDLHAR